MCIRDRMLELLDQLPDAGAEKDFYKVTDSQGKEDVYKRQGGNKSW